jgi:adenylate kinase family enzyme
VPSLTAVAGAMTPDPRRILLIGSGGAGKSTLARQLADRLHLPLIHLDSLYWRAGWVPSPKGEWVAQVDQLIAGEQWIMDGNYGGTLARRLARADTVVWLDLPRTVCLWRVLKRQARYFGRSRPGLPPGCNEKITWEFLAWIWTYPARRRPEIMRQLELAPHATVYRLRSRQDVARFLMAMSA